MEIYAIEKNFMESTDSEYSYIAEMLSDPYNMGENYKPKDVVKMLYDI